MNKEEIEAQEDYKRFSEFWEKARNITDENGDNFLDWDKSNMCHLSFNRGFKQGSQSKEKEIIFKLTAQKKNYSEAEKEMFNDEIKWLEDLLIKPMKNLDEIPKQIHLRLQKLKLNNQDEINRKIITTPQEHPDNIQKLKGDEK